MKLNKWLLNMLLPFLNVNFGIVGDEDGGAGNEGDAGDTEGDLDSGDDTSKNEVDNTDKSKSSISDAEAKLLKDVMAKKKALKDANDNLAKLTAQLQQFEGIDPSKVKALLKEKADAETEQLEKQGQWDKLKTQMAEQHKAEMLNAETLVADLKGQLSTKDSVISELTVGNAFATSDYIKDELILTSNKTRAAYGTHFSYEDGAIVGYDKPAGAKDRTVLVDSSGEPLSFEEALKKIVDADPDRDHILRSKVKQGSGSKTVPAKSKVDTTSKDSGLVGRSRITDALGDFLKGGK